MWLFIGALGYVFFGGVGGAIGAIIWSGVIFYLAVFTSCFFPEKRQGRK